MADTATNAETEEALELTGASPLVVDAEVLQQQRQQGLQP